MPLSQQRRSLRDLPKERNALGGEVSFPTAAHRPAAIAVLRPNQADHAIDEPALHPDEMGRPPGAMASGALGLEGCFHRFLAIAVEKRPGSGRPKPGRVVQVLIREELNT